MQQRNRQLVRTWLLLKLLRAWGGLSLAKLAEETGVTTRTIRRDLEALQDAGVPLMETSDALDWEEKFWKILPTSPCPICNRKQTELRREIGTGYRTPLVAECAVDPVVQAQHVTSTRENASSEAGVPDPPSLEPCGICGQPIRGAFVVRTGDGPSYRIHETCVPSQRSDK